MEEAMPQRGDLVVERLTGKRAIVINMLSPEEVTCRFGDGRLEDRFIFELEPALSLIGSFLSLLVAPFVGRTRENATLAVPGRVRPLILRQPGTS
jgi:hypothetical protein